jgi:long-chain fatty acid transport protein
MKYMTIAAGIVLAMTSTTALAGGIDRSGQGIGFIFETGNYAELTFSSVSPDVRRTPDVFGDIANDYVQFGLAYKTDLNDKLSLGASIDQPYGADVNYTLLSLGAKLNSSALNVVGRYKMNGGFSAHAGLRAVTVGGTFNPAGAGPTVSIANDTDLGYLVGVAYEKPEIALRVALTYNSKTNHTDPGTASSFNAPESINLDFQSGIAKNTLIFGSVRHVNWSDTNIVVGGGTVVNYANDSTSYSLGVGRKFNDNWSGAVTIGYEGGDGLIASALSPTDGSRSIGLGATYTHNNMKITGGIRYVELGDATAPTGVFLDNTAVAIGLKIGFTF